MTTRHSVARHSVAWALSPLGTQSPRHSGARHSVAAYCTVRTVSATSSGIFQNVPCSVYSLFDQLSPSAIWCFICSTANWKSKILQQQQQCYKQKLLLTPFRSKKYFLVDFLPYTYQFCLQLENSGFRGFSKIKPQSFEEPAKETLSCQSLQTKHLNDGEGHT